MNERVQFNEILEGTYDNGVIHLLRNQMWTGHGKSCHPLSKFAVFHDPCLL